MTVNELLVIIGVKVEVNTAQIESFAANINAAIESIRRDIRAITDISAAIDDIRTDITAINETNNQILEVVSRDVEETTSQVEKLKSIVGGVASAIETVVSGMVNFLDASLAVVNDLTDEKKKLYGISQAELDQAEHFNSVAKEKGRLIDEVKTKIVLGLAPSLSKAVSGFNNWIKANKELIINGMSKLIKSAMMVIRVITNTMRWIDKVITSTIGWKAALLLLAAAFAIIKRAMLLAFISNPITLVIAAIAGLFLLIDDLMTFLDGGESAFGNFWKPAVAWCRKVIGWFKAFYDDSKEKIEWLTVVFSLVFDAIKNIIFDALDAIENDFNLIVHLITILWYELSESIKAIWQDIKQYFQAVMDWFGEITNTTFQVLGEYIFGPFKAAFDKIKDYYDKTVGKISNLWEGLKSKTSGAIDGVKEFFGFADEVEVKKTLIDSNSAALSPSNTFGGAVQKIYHGGDATTTVNIMTNNPETVMRGVERGIGNSVRMANAYSEGVLSD